MDSQYDKCSQMMIDLVLSTSRGAVLLISAIGGVLAIYWGWRLYCDSVVSQTSGEAKFKGITLKMVAAGPGVFLAGFGAWLLVHVVNNQLEITDATRARTPTTYEIYDTPRLMPVQAPTTQSPTKCECILERSHKSKLFSGEQEGLTRESVQLALDTAIEELLRVEKNFPTNSDSRAHKLSEAIDVLQTMRDEVSRSEDK